MKHIFTPQDDFAPNEWIFHYKVTALLIISLIIGTYIVCFALYRITQHNLVAGGFELIFGLFLLTAFFLLRKNKTYYMLLSKIFFVFAFIVLIVLFFYIPDETTRIHWVPVTLVLVFFLLDYKGGILFLILYILFILFLMVTHHSYTTIEYVTWISSLSALALIMYYYEKVKEREKSSLINYASALYDEVQKHTKTLKKQNIELFESKKLLQQLNAQLEERIQEELYQHLKQEKILLHQCRLASMGEMMDFIAHQWRQPLMNVNAILMNMDRALEIREEPKEYLTAKMEDLVALTTHMSQTIEDFRSLFKIDKQKVSFDIGKSIAQVLELYESALKNICVHLDAAEEIRIYEHQNEFNQVIIILLGNAIEALNLHNKSTTKSIYINVHVNTQHISIDIEDNAGGIAPKHLKKIFEPYFTTKAHADGTGLGLYIAKIIVERNMHGSLRVINASSGAKFTITLRRSYAETT